MKLKNHNNAAFSGKRFAAIPNLVRSQPPCPCASNEYLARVGAHENRKPLVIPVALF